jgi:hypothetical protein
VVEAIKDLIDDGEPSLLVRVARPTAIFGMQRYDSLPGLQAIRAGSMV